MAMAEYISPVHVDPEKASALIGYEAIRPVVEDRTYSQLILDTPHAAEALARYYKHHDPSVFIHGDTPARILWEELIACQAEDPGSVAVYVVSPYPGIEEAVVLVADKSSPE